MQLPEDRLEVHALAGRYVLRHGLNGALAHKGLREPHRLVQRFALDERAGEHAREHVAGAVKLLADERVEKKLRPAARAVKDARADLALAEHHAGEHHAARSVPAQALNDRAIACLVMRQGAEGMVLAEQHRRLGQVRHDHVRQLRQPRHARAHRGRIGLVDLAVVAHHGIADKDRRAVAAEGAYKVRRKVHLRLAAHEAGVNGIEVDAELRPVCGGLGQLVGHIQKGIAREAAGVRGEIGGRQRAALHAHRAEHRDGDGQRAAAEAGHIVDGGNSRRRHKNGSFLFAAPIIPHRGRIARKNPRIARPRRA